MYRQAAAIVTKLVLCDVCWGDPWLVRCTNSVTYRK
jgi:hypothetical protein